MPYGYKEVSSLTPQGSSYINDLLSQIQSFLPQAAAGYSQFLPGGGGGQPIIDQAMKNYQQRTIPSILNAFGSNSGRGSSGLNQALAGSASDLNTDLGSQLAQLQLSASQGLGQLGLGGGQLGLAGSQRTFMPKSPTFLQNLLLGLLQGGSGIAGGLFSNPGLFG